MSGGIMGRHGSSHSARSAALNMSASTHGAARRCGRFRCAEPTGRNAMSTGKRKPPAEPPTKHEPDRAALEALTDEEIDRQIPEDPDAAPDVSDWPLEKAVMMEPIDVKAIRGKLGMSQPEFARAFSLNLASLRDWEQQRRVPR